MVGGVISKIYSKMLYRYVRFYYHCDIPYNANIQDVYFAHNGLGIVVNPNSKIFSGTFIQHGVTIGEENGLSPIIGHNCFIGARAIIIGGISIGDNVRIGAGAVVVSDIPDNSTAVGVPARIIKVQN